MDTTISDDGESDDKDRNELDMSNNKNQRHDQLDCDWIQLWYISNLLHCSPTLPHSSMNLMENWGSQILFSS